MYVCVEGEVNVLMLQLMLQSPVVHTKDFFD